MNDRSRKPALQARLLLKLFAGTIPFLFLISCVPEAADAPVIPVADSDTVVTYRVDTFHVERPRVDLVKTGAGKKDTTDAQDVESHRGIFRKDTALSAEQSKLKSGTAIGVAPAVDTFWTSDPAMRPSFPGGSPALQAYIQKNLVYPMVAFQNDVKGTVLVRFIVEKDGKADKAEVLKGIGYGCDEAAVDLIKKMPYWTPGYTDGQPYAAAVDLPVSFGYNVGLDK